MQKNFYKYLTILFIQMLISGYVYADPQKIFICIDSTLSAPQIDFAKLKRVDPDGNNLTLIRTGTDTSIRGCHYDSAEDKLFLRDTDPSDRHSKIYKVNPDNSSPQILQFPATGETIYSIFGTFAVNPISSTIY
jgi:hypothetical protein